MTEITKPNHLPRLNDVELETAINFVTDRHWGVRDPARFKVLMAEVLSLVAPPYFLSDNLFTWVRNNSALEDQAFRNAWQANWMGSSDAGIPWRRYMLACSAYHCMHIEGDFVECGAYLGSGVKTVIDYLGGTQFEKPFWVYDTFDHNPVAGRRFAQQEEGLFEKIKERFKDYHQVRLIKGLLPQSILADGPEKIAYLHLDMNTLEGEIAVLEHAFDRVSKGGIVVLDDYERAGSYRNQKIGEDRWFEARGYRIFPLPTGQGLVLKR